MELANPFPIGGIGSSVIATHVGHLPFLPAELSRCYFVAKASHNLLSLGFLHANGGSYKTSGRNCLKVYGIDGALIDVSVRLSTNLYPVSTSPSLSACPAVAQLQGLPHVTATQRDEMDRAEALHQGQAAHVNDDQLCQDIANGLFNGCGVTPAMVRMNRRYRGRCPQCIEGKAKQESFSASDSPALTEPGQCIYADLKSQQSRSAGGRFVSFRSDDGFTGFHDEQGADSKHPQDVFNAIMRTVHSVYNAHGIPVKQVVVDSDPAFVPVISMLAKVGILMTLVNPGQYCQRMEISIQSQDNRCAAVLASLPFVLPAEFHPWARKWVMDCTNGMSNSKTFPTSPRRLVIGTDLPLFRNKFGDVCMVRQYLQKRVQQSKVHGTSVDVEPKAELGVCLGYSSDHPGAMLFLLENGKIVPRNSIALIQVIPFNFVPKKVLQAQLSLPVIDSPAIFQSSIQRSTETVSAPQSIQFGSFPSASLDSTVSLPGPSSVPASVIPSVPAVVNENFSSPLRTSRSLPLNSTLVPLRLVMSPDGTIVNSAVSHTVAPSIVESFVAPPLSTVPILRRSTRNIPVVSGLISLVSDKSTCILRSLNLIRSPDGTIVLSPLASEFIPSSVSSALPRPKLVQHADGTIGLA